MAIRQSNDALVDAKRGTTARQPGAQPGNSNALKHGRWSAGERLRRKLSMATVKALAHIIDQHALAQRLGRFRIRPLRCDQLALLRQHDPALLQLLHRRSGS